MARPNKNKIYLYASSVSVALCSVSLIQQNRITLNKGEGVGMSNTLIQFTVFNRQLKLMQLNKWLRLLMGLYFIRLELM